MEPAELAKQARELARDVELLAQGWDPDERSHRLDPDDASQRIWDMPLSIEQEICHRIVFGTGGPHREVQLFYNPDDWDDRPLRGVYLFMDWGTRDEWPLTDEQARIFHEWYGWQPE